MMFINSTVNLPIDKVIEACKIAYDNLNAKRTEKVNQWFDIQFQKHRDSHNKKWFKSEYKQPTDEELVNSVDSITKSELNYCRSFHNNDGIVISSIHEAARFAKQLGADSIQVDANSLYCINYWYHQLADKK